MNFLFVDRILELTPGKQTVGLKHVTVNDTYLTANKDHKLSLMPCVVGEALGQLCSWNVLKTSDFCFRPVGGVIQEIQMVADAYMGDTILLESDIESLDIDNQMVTFSGRASVQGKTLLIIKNSLAPLLPLQEFNDGQRVQADFAKLYQPQVEFEKQNLPINAATKPYPIHYDKILSWQIGQEVVAQKNVSFTAPYFADHFPKKSVLPLSLLMEYNLQLAHTFIAEGITIPDNKNLRPSSVRKVKIGHFVLPGDRVITRITLKEHDADRFIVNFHNTVDNKKVCVAEAEFEL